MYDKKMKVSYYVTMTGAQIFNSLKSESHGQIFNKKKWWTNMVTKVALMRQWNILGPIWQTSNNATFQGWVYMGKSKLFAFEQCNLGWKTCKFFWVKKAGFAKNLRFCSNQICFKHVSANNNMRMILWSQHLFLRDESGLHCAVRSTRLQIQRNAKRL